MSKWMKVGAVVVGIALVAACGDDTTGPGGEELTNSEKTALANALAQADVNGAFGGFGSLASVVVQTVGSVGKLDAGTSASVTMTEAVEKALSLGVSTVLGASYAGAVGFVIDYDFAGESGYFTGVVGWNGLTSSGVSELVAAGLIGLGTAPTSGSGTIGTSANAFGAYYNGANSFAATEGSVAITGGSFGGSATDCSASSQGVTVDCEYRTGSLGGNFQFVATGIPSGGSYTQTPVTFSGLPAVRITIAISQ